MRLEKPHNSHEKGSGAAAVFLRFIVCKSQHTPMSYDDDSSVANKFWAFIFIHLLKLRKMRAMQRE